MLQDCVRFAVHNLTSRQPVVRPDNRTHAQLWRLNACAGHYVRLTCTEPVYVPDQLAHLGAVRSAVTERCKIIIALEPQTLMVLPRRVFGKVVFPFNSAAVHRMHGKDSSGHQQSPTFRS